MSQIPIPELVSHSQKVCRLYKSALRNFRSWMPTTVEIRYHSVILRDRFDKNKDIKDLRLAKQLLIQGQQELKDYYHPTQLPFPESAKGGPAYNREFPMPDWILDYWDPMEKAMYPKYFAKREQRKKDYIEFFSKNYMSQQKV